MLQNSQNKFQNMQGEYEKSECQTVKSLSSLTGTYIHTSSVINEGSPVLFKKHCLLISP